MTKCYFLIFFGEFFIPPVNFLAPYQELHPIYHGLTTKGIGDEAISCNRYDSETGYFAYLQLASHNREANTEKGGGKITLKKKYGFF